jgi:hypothetical protein
VAQIPSGGLPLAGTQGQQASVVAQGEAHGRVALKGQLLIQDGPALSPTAQAPQHPPQVPRAPGGPSAALERLGEAQGAQGVKGVRQNLEALVAQDQATRQGRPLGDLADGGGQGFVGQVTRVEGTRERPGLSGTQVESIGGRDRHGRPASQALEVETQHGNTPWIHVSCRQILEAQGRRRTLRPAG